MFPSVHLVIASHLALFREALAVALRNCNGYSTATVTLDPRAVLECLQRKSADIVLLTRDPLEDDSLPTLSALSSTSPETSVLIVGAPDSEAAMASYLEAGAKGYVTNDASFEELKLALTKVMRGEVVCSAGTARFMFGRLAHLGGKNARLREIKSVNLTFRELDILRLIASGYTNEEIGHRLSISVHTVKNHVHNILHKLEVDSRLRAVHLAYEKKWLRLASTTAPDPS